MYVLCMVVYLNLSKKERFIYILLCVSNMGLHSRIGGMKDVSNDNEFEMGTEIWNIAGGFTHQKLLKLIAKLDTYETIAQFGKEEIDYDFELSRSQTSVRRIEGLKRLASTLRQLCGNVRFAIQAKDATYVKTLMNRVDTVTKYIDSCLITKDNLVTKKQENSINEKLFTKCLDILSEIKDDINFPMNRAGLIFRRTDDIDLDKIKTDIVFGG